MRGLHVSSLRLVAVSPARGSSDDVVAWLRAAFAGGATAVWIRERERISAEQFDLVARARSIADAHGGGVLVSGSDVALLDAGGHALQIGRHEPHPRVIRERVGTAATLGVSVHDPLDVDALAVADFAILAPVFAVPGKGVALGVDRFRELVRASPVPVVGLGGIDASNAAAVIAAGAAGVAVQRAIAGARDPAAATRALRGSF